MIPLLRVVVVVGAGLAGLRAAESLRENGYRGEIIIVGDEGHHPYNRPPLSKDVLLGKASASDIAIPFAHSLGAQWRFGSPAAKLDTANRTVHLKSGEEIPYDGLIVATGAAAARPPCPGCDLSGLFTLRTIDDALVLRRQLLQIRSLAVVGAGLIGCEVAAVARTMQIEVTLIDAAAAPMARVLGLELGSAIASMQTRHGVRLELGSSLEKVERDGERYVLTLTNRIIVAADAVLLAVGAAPSSAWLQGSGLRIDNGIVCDARCFALDGDERVVAAGDVARWSHPDFGAPIRVEHWTNASEQATAAAAALLDPAKAGPFRPLLSFWSDQYSQRLHGIGAPWLATKIDFKSGSAENQKFLAIGSHDGRIVGAVGMNMPGALAGCRGLIGTLNG